MKPETSTGKPWAGVLMALSLGAPANRLSPSFRPTLRQVFSACYLKWRFPLAYALWRELRTIPYRILEIHERGLAENGLHLGAEIETLPDGSRRRDADARSRIEDIQNLQTERPWATLLDHLPYLEGREAGLASCAGNGHSPRRKRLPQSSNVTPNQAVRQLEGRA
jgi:hypothetical protein